MTKSIPARFAIAILAVATLGLPTWVYGQTDFSFNVVLNDGVDLQVEVLASTSTSPATVGEATIDMEFDGSLFTYVNDTGGVLRAHNQTWGIACLALFDFGTCGSATPYSVGGEGLNDGADYVRLTIVPTHAPDPDIGDDLGGGFLVDGYELPSTPVVLTQLNFSVNTPSQPGTSSKTAAPVPPVSLTFRTNTLAFGFFDSEDNSNHTNTIVDDCSGGEGCNVNDLALPVELVDFSAVNQDGDVVLNWSTASETNNAGFSVEHAAGEGTFEEVGFVDGAGTSLDPHSYTYTVKDLDVGQHRFRLKQIDYDGATRYSGVLETTIELTETHRLSPAYPNPFNPSTTFELVVARDQRVRIDIINALGQRVERLFDGNMEANRPTNFTFDAGTLPTGLYFYRVVGENFAQTRQVLLVK